MKIAVCFLIEKQTAFCVFEWLEKFFQIRVGIRRVPVGIGEGT